MRYFSVSRTEKRVAPGNPGKPTECKHSAGPQAAAMTRNRMAFYHLHQNDLTREKGSSATQMHDYITREGYYRDDHDEVMFSESGNVPSCFSSPAEFWVACDEYERANGRMAVTLEFSLPAELTAEQQIDCVQGFVSDITSKENLPFTYAIHKGKGQNPHCHLMISERKSDDINRTPETFFKRFNRKNPEIGGAEKSRALQPPAWLRDTRKTWENHANEQLARAGYNIRIDCRSYKDMGITDLKPQVHLGPAGARVSGDRQAEFDRIARENGEVIKEDPSTVLSMLTANESTFTRFDAAKLANRYSADPEQFQQVLDSILSSDKTVNLGHDEKGNSRYTTRELLEIESSMLAGTDRLSGKAGHQIDQASAEQIFNEKGLSQGQKEAGQHIINSSDITCVRGFAGSGKSYMMNAVRETYETNGYRVRGAALAGIAAKGLEESSGIKSETIHSTLYKWEQGKDLLTNRDVFVIDEAGMVGTRQMSSLVRYCDEAGAKLVLIGDSQQLQAVEAGGALQAIVARTGEAELSEIRRQREEWQAQATRDLADGRATEALKAYEAARCLHDHATGTEARAALVQDWYKDPAQDKIMLAYLRVDVADLNDKARQLRLDAGEIQPGQVVETFRGQREFSAGDKFVFLKNDRTLGVKNGTVGEVGEIDAAGNMVVNTEGRQVSFNAADYDHIDHGYALTVHKSQGATVDSAYVYANEYFDKHSAYVAMSRHRDTLNVYYDRDQFKNGRQSLAWYAERVREKELATGFAEARSIEGDIAEQRALDLLYAEPTYNEKEAIVAAIEAEKAQDYQREMDQRGQRMAELLRAKPVYKEQPDYLSQYAAKTGHNRQALSNFLASPGNRSAAINAFYSRVPADIRGKLEKQAIDQYRADQKIIAAARAKELGEVRESIKQIEKEQAKNDEKIKNTEAKLDNLKGKWFKGKEKTAVENALSEQKVNKKTLTDKLKDLNARAQRLFGAGSNGYLPPKEEAKDEEAQKIAAKRSEPNQAVTEEKEASAKRSEWMEPEAPEPEPELTPERQQMWSKMQEARGIKPDQQHTQDKAPAQDQATTDRQAPANDQRPQGQDINQGPATSQDKTPAQNQASQDKTSAPAQDQATTDRQAPANDQRPQGQDINQGPATGQDITPAQNQASQDKTSAPAQDQATTDRQAPANDQRPQGQDINQGPATGQDITPAQNQASQDKTSAPAQDQATTDRQAPANDQRPQGQDINQGPATGQDITPAQNQASQDKTSAPAQDQATTDRQAPANDQRPQGQDINQGPATGKDITPAQNQASQDKTSAPAQDQATTDRQAPANDQRPQGQDINQGPATGKDITPAQNQASQDKTSAPAQDQATTDRQAPANDQRPQGQDINQQTAQDKAPAQEQEKPELTPERQQMWDKMQEARAGGQNQEAPERQADREQEAPEQEPEPPQQEQYQSPMSR